MLLVHAALLWLMQVGAARSQLFPFQNLINPIANIPNLLQFNRPAAPPKTREDIIAESRLKKCCGHLHQADPYCRTQYCGFDAISKDKVRSILLPTITLIAD